MCLKRAKIGMIIADLILITISLAALIFATVTDIKIKEVPDWLSYALMISGLSIRLMQGVLFNKYSYFLYGIIGLLSMLIIGNILYHTKQWGGGDAKLLMGIGATLATTPFYLEKSSIPFLGVVFILIMLSGAFYGIIWSLFLIHKDTKKFKEEFKKINKMHYIKLLKIVSFIIICLFITILFFVPSTIKPIIISLLLIIICYPYIFIAIKSVESLYLYTFFSVDKLMEGDWIVNDIKRNNKIIFYKKAAITNRDIEKLKELNIKKVLIKDGIPFVPSFLIGTVLALIIGNPLA